MIELKPFQFEHFDLFAWREEDRKLYDVNSEFVSEFINAKDAECWTAIEDGRIVCIGGVVKRTGKTGYCFTIFSKYATGKSVGVARIVRRQFFAIISTLGLHRVVTYNRASADTHNKWVEWLGFKFECVAEMFDDEGNDFHQYALIVRG